MGSSYLIRLMRDEEVMSSLVAFAKKHRISAAYLSGLGAMRDTTVGYYSLKTKSYIWNTFTKDHEVLAFIGNISLLDGKPFVHAHVTLSDDSFRAHGGHLKEGYVAVTLEIALTPLTGAVARAYDEGIGLNLLVLPDCSLAK